MKKFLSLVLALVMTMSLVTVSAGATPAGTCFDNAGGRIRQIQKEETQMKKFLSLVLALVMTMSLVTVSAGAKAAGTCFDNAGGRIRQIQKEETQMKKFLSLVLALVMTMSLVTVSAGAKDFTDDSKIQYQEAVDVMSAVDVIDGYSDGSFNPQGTLTRGAAAKIICNLILGPTTAAELHADTAPYKDVPANHTFAGYIAYCAQQGIISGYADGAFRPAATLTSYAFMKMLLGALGYDSEIEGYVGSNWSIQVAKRALNIGLDDGLNGDFNGIKAVTREEACLYALNTMTADMVDYDSRTSVSVGGSEVVIAGSKAQEVVNNNKKETIYDDEVMQFAEKYFSDLKLSKGTDDFSRPANVWKNKAEEIGTYADAADATYTVKVEAGDIYKDLGLGSTVDKKDVTVYEDGKELKDGALDIKKGSDVKVGNTDKGVLTEVYYDSKADTMDIITINFYVGEVNRTVKATAKKDAYIVIDTENVKPDGVGGALEFETNETFEDDAFVVFSYSQSAEEVKTVALAESVNGTVSRAVNDTDDEDKNVSVTIDGTKYDGSKNVAGVKVGEVSVNNDYNIYLDRAVNDTDDEDKNVSVTIDGTKYDGSKNVAGVKVGEVSVNNDYNIYLDSYGYMIYIEEDEFLSSDYALVLAAQNKDDFSSNRALLAFGDGSERVVDTAKNYKSGDNAIPVGTIVTYKVDDDKVYTLKPVSTTYTSNTTVDKKLDMDDFAENYDSLRLTNDKAGITVGNMYTITRAADSKVWEYSDSAKEATLTSNSKTVFVVYDAEDDEYSVYTGIKNAPTITPSAGDVEISYYCKSGKMATIMFIYVEKSADIDEYSVYTGIKNAPTITPSAGDVEISYYCKSGKMATIMFIYVEKSADIEDDNNKGLFLAGESVSKLIHDTDGDYFEYNAIVNGEIKVVKVDEDLGKTLNGFYKTYSVDKHGIITDVSDADANHGYAAYSTGAGDPVEYLTGDGVNKVSEDYTVILDTKKDGGKNETITVADEPQIFYVDEDGIEYLTGDGVNKVSEDYTVILDTKKDGGKNETITVADEPQIFYVDEDGKISESSYRSISKDENDKVYALVDEYLVTNLVIEEVPADEKPYVDEDGKISESSYRSISKDENDKVYALVDEYLVTNLVIEEVPADEKPDRPAKGDFEFTTLTPEVKDTKKIGFSEATCTDTEGWDLGNAKVEYTVTIDDGAAKTFKQSIGNIKMDQLVGKMEIPGLTVKNGTNITVDVVVTFNGTGSDTASTYTITGTGYII